MTPTTNPYAARTVEPAPFQSALSAALEATEAVEDIVLAPTRTVTAPVRPAPQAGPVAAPARPAESAQVADVPDASAPSVKGNARKGWTVQADTLVEAVRAAEELPGTMGEARRVMRGMGPWRRESFVVTVVPAADTTDAPAADAVDTPGAADDQVAVAATTPAVTAPTESPEPVEVPTTATTGMSLRARLELIATTAEPAAARDQLEDEVLPRPVLPPLLPTIEGPDVRGRLAAVGLSGQLLDDVASFDPSTSADWLEALTVVIDTALEQAGTLDERLGGEVVHGVGPAGAAALANAAAAGRAIGQLTWRGTQWAPSGDMLARVVVHGLLP